MSNNFRRTAVLKKNDLQTKTSLLRIPLKKFEGGTCRLEDLEPLFTGKITDKYMENIKQASGEI